MKRKSIKLAMLFVFLILGLIVIGYQSNSLRANPINPECANGCKEGSGGCYCYQYYKDLREAKWKVQKLENATISENW